MEVSFPAAMAYRRKSTNSMMPSRSYKYDGPSPPHRFVRLNPRFDRDETLELLKVRVCVWREISCKRCSLSSTK